MPEKKISPADIFLAIFLIIGFINCVFWFYISATCTEYTPGTVVSIDAETIQRVCEIEIPHTSEYTFDTNGKIMAETPIYKEPGYVLIKADKGYYYGINDNYILGQKVWYKPIYKESDPRSMVSATDPLQELPAFMATILSTDSFFVVIAAPFIIVLIICILVT